MSTEITKNYDLVFSKKSSSLDDTLLIGKELSTLIKPGMVVGFMGELGAGKTELIRAICLSLGDNSQVSSPTYTLENQYFLGKELCISHWDLYRLHSVEEIYAEILEQKSLKKSLILVEWPELVSDLLDLLVLISSAREISLFASKNKN